MQHVATRQRANILLAFQRTLTHWTNLTRSTAILVRDTKTLIATTTKDRRRRTTTNTTTTTANSNTTTTTTKRICNGSDSRRSTNALNH